MVKFSKSTVESTFPGIHSSLRHFLSTKGSLFSIWPYRLLRTGLAVIFIWSGLSKLENPLVFNVLIDSYGLVPDTWTPFISYALPVLEVVAGCGLLFDLKGNLAAIVVMLIGFMSILGYGIHMGLDVDCGCFGPDDPEAEAYHGLRSAFYRDILLLVVIAYLYAWRYRHNYVPLHLNDLIRMKKGD